MLVYYYNPVYPAPNDNFRNNATLSAAARQVCLLPSYEDSPLYSPSI